MQKASHRIYRFKIRPKFVPKGVIDLRAEHLSPIDNAEVTTLSEELPGDDPPVALSLSATEPVRLSEPTLTLTAVREATP